MPTALIVEHPVHDYDAWRPVFDDHGTSRKEHGCTGERVYRAADDSNMICIVMTYPSREHARSPVQRPAEVPTGASAGRGPIDARRRTASRSR